MRKLIRCILVLLFALLSAIMFALPGFTALTSIPAAYALDNGLARTPPMGFNDWNAFHCSVNEALMKQIADTIVSTGLRDAGYVYVNVDDCWALPQRDSHGNLVPDPAKFPDGIKGLASYVHSKGLKFGIYEDAGTATCSTSHPVPGSLGHEKQDANLFASWGVDYLKYDNCNNNGLAAQPRYTAMRDALLASGRPIVFSICNWGQESPWNWGSSTGNLWRTTGDIHDTWASMIGIYGKNEPLYSHAGPGHWNDPDMLEVGNGGMSTTEYQTHFSLWAEMAAPLLIGTDLRSASSATKNILLNKAVIAIDQDSLGVQGHRVSSSGNSQVLTKSLANGDVAVVLLNTGDSTATISTTASAVGAHSASNYTLTNLWTNAKSTTSGTIKASVASHGVVMFRVHAG